MELTPEIKKKRELKLPKHFWKYALIFLGLLIIGVLARPTIVGYSVHQQIQDTNYTVEDYGNNVNDLINGMAILETNLSLHSDFNKQLKAQLDQAISDLSQCTTKKAECEVYMESHRTELDELKEELDEKEEELESKTEELEADCSEEIADSTKELTQGQENCVEQLNSMEEEVRTVQEDFDAFVASIARSVCCKERVDNANINYYSMIDNKLVCLEESGEALTC